jgi:hypothetical protein
MSGLKTSGAGRKRAGLIPGKWRVARSGKKECQEKWGQALVKVFVTFISLDVVIVISGLHNFQSFLQCIIN